MWHFISSPSDMISCQRQEVSVNKAKCQNNMLTCISNGYDIGIILNWVGDKVLLLPFPWKLLIEMKIYRHIFCTEQIIRQFQHNAAMNFDIYCKLDCLWNAINYHLLCRTSNLYALRLPTTHQFTYVSYVLRKCRIVYVIVRLIFSSVSRPAKRFICS